MNVLSWNCRGLGNPETVRALKKILGKQSPQIVFLIEPKLLDVEMNKINSFKLGYKGCFPVSCRNIKGGRSGGICMLWSEQLDVIVRSYSPNHILIDIAYAEGRNWSCVGFYGWPEKEKKKLTWDLMKEVYIMCSPACLFVGDFNEVLLENEKKGGLRKMEKDMWDFRETISHCNMDDLGFKGNIFTWSNKRKGEDHVACCLDRALAIGGWKDLFPFFSVCHLPKYKSDHAPLLISGGMKEADFKPGKRPFRFEHMWFQHPGFEDLCKKSWERAATCGGLIEKVGIFKEEIINWARNEFGNIRKKKEDLCLMLEDLQKKEEEHAANLQIDSIEAELDDILKKEEIMWMQRSKTHWMKEGDQNTRFFHQKASNRRRRNTIHKIIDRNGNLISDNGNMSKEIRSYFKELFKKEICTGDLRAWNAIKPKVTAEMNDLLMKEYTEEEIV